MVGGERLTERQAEALRDRAGRARRPAPRGGRAAIAKAREFGDLSENFEYHAAKNEQGLLEARIRTLRARLDGAEIVAEAGSDQVGDRLGRRGRGQRRQTITVEVSAVGGSGTVSPTSPLGAALLGHKLGETVDVAAPQGAWQATITASLTELASASRRCNTWRWRRARSSATSAG